MNIETYSPVLVLMFVFALLWILMGIHFRNLTRTQKWLIPLLILILVVFNHILRQQLGLASYSKMILLTMHVPYFLIFLHITKCGVAKMAFMIFSAVVFTAPTIFVGNLTKELFVGSESALLLANLLTYGIVLLIAQFVFRPGFNYLIKYGENQFLQRFFLIPFLYYIYMFAVMNVDLPALSSVGGFVVRILPTIYAFVFYALLLRNYKELNEKKEILASQTALTQALSAAEEQIELLNEAQTQTAIHQHEMRHHLTIIEGFLAADKPRLAAEYIQEVRSDVESIAPKRFCENEIVNLLCASFTGKAERFGIRLAIEAKLPKQLSVSDTELCSMVSNGLENALHAVAALELPLKWVSFFCGIRNNKLLIEIKNPYAGEITMEDGLPISLRENHGYGCYSIRTIAERNRGHCTFEPENGLFTLRVVLPMYNEAVQG